MNSSKSSDELPRSMKNLWTLLSGSLSLKSFQFVADELEQNQKILINGILYYKNHDPTIDSVEKIQKLNIDIMKPNSLYKLSRFLDLNAQQCLDLFQSFILYELRGTPDLIKSMFSNEKKLKNLFENLWDYYYSERIFSLFCLKQILSHWKENDHIYSKIFKDFLIHINNDGQIANKLVEQLKSLNRFQTESLKKNGQFLSESTIKNLQENIVREQIEVLELLLIYFRNFEPNSQIIMDVITLFNQNDYKNDGCQKKCLNDFCRFLKILLIVEFFDPNQLYRSRINGVDHYLFREDNLESIKRIDSIISNLKTSTQEHSLIFFSWMIINLLTNIDSQNNVQRFGQSALQLRLFHYIEYSLTLEPMILLRKSFVHNVIFEIIGNLFSVTFSVFDFEKLLLNEPHLDNLLILLFSNDTIAQNLLESDPQSGLGLVFTHLLGLFPHKIHFLLSLLNSLAETKACKNLFEKFPMLNTITSYTESLCDFNDEVVLIENDTLVLRKNRRPFLENNLIIAEGTTGTIFYHEGIRLIKWNIALNGWFVIYCRLKYIKDQIKQGTIYSTINDEVVLNEISKISFICAELISHNAHQNIQCFDEIIKQLLELFHLAVSNNQTTVRLFMASIIKLCCSMMQHNYMDHKQAWFHLHEKRFFPYLIGFSNRFDQIVFGQDTSVSTLGYILASEEFIEGNYDLTDSFLSLMIHLTKEDKFLDDNITIASFVFMINEIFSSYKLWNYRRPIDLNRIEKMCFEIIFNIIKKACRKRTNELTTIEKICIVHLMEGNASQQLLTTLKNGEEFVRMKIVHSGNERLLTDDDQILSIRTTISILSCLLEMYPEINKLSSSQEKSVIEKIILSSTNNSNPNLLLIFTYFVCQKYNIYLAINAIQLLDQLASRFPMSMLACFGSNTEHIRDHFLFRLETVTEDINFKIALLNFLSTCVRYQPGLVEMFLNVQNGNEDSSVLDTIIEILEEKRSGHFHCPKELHQASLQFITKFWLQLNVIAMNKLKTMKNFWKLISFHLFSEKNAGGDDLRIDNALTSLTLKIFSREIHHVKIFEKGELSLNLQEIFDEMIEKKVFLRISTHIQQSLIVAIDSEIDDELINLIEGWRDFIAAWYKLISNQKQTLVRQIILDLLEDVLIIISPEKNISNNFNRILNKFSNLLLILVSNDSVENDRILLVQKFAEKITKIFKIISKNKETISFNSQISLSVFLLNVIRSHQDDNDDDQVELFSSVCDLLNNSFKILAKSFVEGTMDSLNLEKRLIIANLSIINQLLSILPERSSEVNRVSRMIKILRSFGINEQISNLFIFCLRNRIHLDLVTHLANYFVQISHHHEGSEMINNLNLINQISIYFVISNNDIDSSGKNLASNYMLLILSQTIRIVISSIINMRHHFIETSISFVAVYMDIFEELFNSFRRRPSFRLVRLIHLILELCSALSKYVREWRNLHSISLERMRKQILFTSNTMIAYVLRPALINKMIEDDHRLFMESTIAKDGEQEFCDRFQTYLMQMLLNSMKFLLDLSPSIIDIFENNENLVPNGKFALLFSTSFSVPNVDSIDIISFGSIVNLINYLIKNIYKREKDLTTGPVKKIESIHHNLIDNKAISIILLELSLVLFFIQTLLAKNSDKINPMEKQIFLHEITNEVNTFKSNLISKTHRLHQNSFSSSIGSPHSKISPLKTATTSQIQLLKNPMIKMMINLFDNFV
ncbi:Nucleoporin -like protein [Sarcoptes scabiei]|uniref:Nucleoporin -like protein n=1 Tax=Sarcoptes scabiei TaxID=52283 RepID=A0A834VDJ3_SARSC|nr:Nucleoporin -like protein [Sarcoptes scabiei]